MIAVLALASGFELNYIYWEIQEVVKLPTCGYLTTKDVAHTRPAD